MSNRSSGTRTLRPRAAAAAASAGQEVGSSTTTTTTRAPPPQQKRRAAKRRGKRGAANEEKEDPSLGAGKLTVHERDTLLAHYYNVDKPASLTSSPKRLYAALKSQLPSLTLAKCKFFLQTQSPYTLTATPRTYIERNPIIVYRCFEMLSCDILVMRQFAETTAPERYCLLVIDTFSRYAWPLFLNTRSAGEVVSSFEQLLEQLRPRLLKTTIFFDQESAIKSKQFRDMIKKFDVQLQFSYTSSKVSHAEILIRNLKRTLYRFALYSRNADLVDILRHIVETYNHTVHSALHGMTPAQVINSLDAEYRLFELRFPQLVAGEPIGRGKVHKNTPPIGSFVRIKKKRQRFAKETDPLQTSFSNAVYQVVGYNRMHGPSVRLRLIEVGSKHVLRRLYYTDEVILSIFNPDQHYIIEKVLGHRVGAGGRREVLVKFLDYTGPQAKMWIAESDLVADYKNIFN